MFVSFGRRLRGLGGMHVGFRLKGSEGCFYACLFAFMNFFIYLLWYCLIGVFWMMYGMCYLFFYLPIKGIIKLCKKEKQKRKIAEASQKYTRDNINP